MSKLDAYELKVLRAFEKGQLKSVATKGELEKLKAAARATAIKDRRVKAPRREPGGRSMPAAQRDSSMIYTLTVECIGGLYLEAECARVIEIKDDSTLEDLHFAIQSAVSFDNDHLYGFHAGRNYRNRKVRYASSGDWDEDEGAYSRIQLRDVYPLGSLKLYYIFDFGDSWAFEIRKSRRVHAPEPRVRYPRVIERRGPSPEQYPSWE